MGPRRDNILSSLCSTAPRRQMFTLFWLAVTDLKFGYHSWLSTLKVLWGYKARATYDFQEFTRSHGEPNWNLEAHLRSLQKKHGYIGLHEKPSS